LDPARDFPRSLGGQFRRHLPAYLMGGAVLAVFQLAMNRIDWLSKAAIDDIFGGRPEDAWKSAALILVLAVLALFTRVASRWFIFNAGRDVEYELRAVLLAHLHRLGAAFYRKMSAGEIMSRQSNDLLQVRLLYGFGVLNITNVVFAFASALQVMVRISLALTLASFATTPVLIALTRSFARALYLRTRSNQDKMGRLSDVLQKNLAGVRVVRSFALETRELWRFQEANKDYLEASLGLARIRGLFGPILGATNAVGVLIFFWYGATLLLDGSLSPGSFFAFWMALGRMTWPMIALGFALSIIQRGRAGYARLKEVLDAEPEVTDGPEPAPAELEGSVLVEHLTFAHGERKILDDVSFEVKKGRSLAIVGRTGAGKSTLAMCLARLLPTPAGAVKVGGHDVCAMPVLSVRGAIGYAQQDAFLFSTTVTRNVGFALEEPDSDEALAQIEDAAREAQVLEEARGFPEGFDTVVGERGVQLSGGQKQRIALARALAWEPKILVLDDPLSAVDAKTEARILDAIERQAKERTVILITHRVAAAARCDSIIVLDQGRIIEQGTHDELAHAGGLYSAFAEEQSMAMELDAIDVDAPPSAPYPGAVEAPS
jgi:ATP-binding cassette, subfamily B, multidrug efflux pump